MAVVSLALLAGCGGSSRRSFAFTPHGTLPSLGAIVVRGAGPLPASGFHGAPAATVRAAERVARANTLLARLLRLGGGRLRGGAQPWQGFGGKLHGAVLDYALKRPVAVDADLPFAISPPDAPSHGTCVTPYAPGWAHLRARRVTALMVLVDLRLRRVAEISTNATRGTVGPVPGKPYPTCNEDQTG